ncbi:MAG: SRPBCC domain-containing protein [Reyranellales bacterium]
MAESFSGLILRMTRTFDAPPDRVFDAWTDPEQFGTWFGPVGMKTVMCELDAKVGGAWRLMGEGNNMRPTVSGKYLEIEPPRRLVFTMAWHEKADFSTPRGHETVVTILFTPAGERTDMVFTQAEFKEQSALAAHNRGWTDSLDKLGDLLRRAA